ncbi:MAG: DUF3465 domain-containing protein [Steroidobacteraceae bacterium]
MRTKALVAAAAFLLAGVWAWQQRIVPDASAVPVQAGQDPAATAFARRASGEWMYLQGKVERILADDNDGSRHQRFILKTSEGHTVLVAHNIDVAPRLDGLRTGETLGVRGEYQWNELGGVMHWTHHDPHGQRQGGYIERMGRRYE